MAPSPPTATVNYSFTVTPGTYSVANVAPAGYTQTWNQGNEATDSDIGTPPARPAVIVMSSGAERPTVDAGLYRPELGDRVVDTNGNGQQDAGEAGVAGVKVTLLDASRQRRGSPHTTDANGQPPVHEPAPGTQRPVRQDHPPAGYASPPPTTGRRHASDSRRQPTGGKTAQTVLDSAKPTAAGTPASSPTPGITGACSKTPTTTTGDTPSPGVTVVLKDPNGQRDGGHHHHRRERATTAFNQRAGRQLHHRRDKPAGLHDVGDKDGGDPNSDQRHRSPGQTNSGNVFVDERLAAIGQGVATATPTACRTRAKPAFR